MKKVLVNPDIHGRTFWKLGIEKSDVFDRIIFLGDYLDPYDFEGITEETAIENFVEVLAFKKSLPDKVVLLLGNHDLPYYSTEYYGFLRKHSRHSVRYHNRISEMFEENRDCFGISHVEGDVLFTHAGVVSGWLENIVGEKSADIIAISDALNRLTKDEDGMRKLFRVSRLRGGLDEYGSCVWADKKEMILEQSDLDKTKRPINRIKQVFGHTLLVYLTLYGNVIYGEPLEFRLWKMVDVARPIILDCDSFKIESV